ncbi:PH domain-containing protein [Prauserella oleivorans]|uniref:PH domain-containing protein n=1 Tax=Prauserella oleivorans TaxID=1478153 RepID=A0ABW5W8G9_9PSEU
MSPTEVTWSYLDRRTIVASTLTVAGVCVAAGVPTAIGIATASLGWALGTVIPAAVLIVAGTVVVETIRLRKTRYRVLPDRVELTKGIVVRTRRSVARDRVRTVDLTAGPLARYLGIVTVKIDTGEQSEWNSSSFALYAVSRDEGERLRAELLDRASAGEATEEGRLATFDPRWIRYAPLSFVTPTLGVAAYGAVLQVAEWFGLQNGVITWTIDLLSGFGLVGGIAVVVVVGLVIGLIGSLGLFVEMWWNYRLDRESAGTLRVRRGLLTSRSISLEEERLRGVELVEPLGVRTAGAARVDAVATGLRQQKDDDKTDRKTLLPAAPRAEADRVAAAVLREAVPPTSAVRLRAHPVAARGRRIRWALATVAVPVLTLALLGLLLSVDVLLHLAWICALVGVPIGVVLAVDAYRNLGHGLTGGYLVARSGTVRRATVALQRRGVIGWTARQSIFQRRKGLLNLTATTAAGTGAYTIYDVGENEGLAFAEEAVPDLFGPFLERR